MPDPAPERARLKSYKDWLGIRQTISPPLPENSIYFLPYMDAEYSSKLIEMGISKEDEIRDLTVLKKSTRKYLTAKAEGVRSVDKDRLATFLSDISYPIFDISLIMRHLKVFNTLLGWNTALSANS